MSAGAARQDRVEDRQLKGDSTFEARQALAAWLVLLLAGCAGTPPPERIGAPPQPPAAVPEAGAPAPARKPAWVLKRGGGYYQDDGPGDNPPDNLDAIPEAVPRAEPLHRFANRPYAVLGRSYTPAREPGPYRERGVASWYGRKFHGQKTSSGEPYDMYAMTAAHPTLPIPSYVRVTNLENGRSVVLRVNDRGPFHDNRLIDLSYTAAHKLGYVERGSVRVEVESVLPQVAGPGLAPTAVLASAQGMSALAAVEDDPIAAFAAADTPTVLPTTSSDSGIFLQLGAFASRDSAESLGAHLARQLDWLSERLHVHAAEGMFKLQLGPYASVQEARRTAARLGEALGSSPFVIQR